MNGNAFTIPHYESHPHLGNSPLVEIVCQISFPAILKITDSIDPLLQDEFSDYPFYDLIREPSFIANENNMPTASFINNHQFSSEDRNERINIRNNSFAFTSNRYMGWDDYFSKLQKCFNSFLKAYTPSVIIRKGLRYVNFLPSDLYAIESGKTLSGLIRKPFAGPIADYAHYDPAVHAYNAELVVSIDEKTSSRLVYGLATRTLNNLKVFLVDIDVFSEIQAPVAESMKTILSFHDYAYDMFRWVVTDDGINNFM